MKTKFLLATLLLFSIKLHAQYISVSSGGDWNDTLTWSNHQIPPAGADVNILGHVYTTGTVDIGELLIYSETMKPARLTAATIICGNLVLNSGSTLEATAYAYVNGDLQNDGTLIAPTLSFSGGGNQSILSSTVIDQVPAIYLSGSNKTFFISAPLSLKNAGLYLNYNPVVFGVDCPLTLDGGYLIDGTVASELTMNGSNGAYISGVTFDENVILQGRWGISGYYGSQPVFQKNLTNTDTLEYKDYPAYGTSGNDGLTVTGKLTNNGLIRGHYLGWVNGLLTSRALNLQVSGILENKSRITAFSITANQLWNQAEIDSVFEIWLTGDLVNNGLIDLTHSDGPQQLILGDEHTYHFSGNSSGHFYGSLVNDWQNGNHPEVVFDSDFTLSDGALGAVPLDLAGNTLFVSNYQFYGHPISGSAGSGLVSKGGSNIFAEISGLDYIELYNSNSLHGSFACNLINHDSLTLDGDYFEPFEMTGDLTNYGYIDQSEFSFYPSIDGALVNKGILNIAPQIAGDLVQAGIIKQNTWVAGNILWAGYQADPNTYLKQTLPQNEVSHFYFGPDLQNNLYYQMAAHNSGSSYEWFKDQNPLQMYGSALPFSIYYPLDSTRTGSYTCVVNGTDTSAALIVSNLYRTEPVYPDGDRLIPLESTFTWKKLPYADKYRVQIAEDKYFTTIAFEDSSLTDTSTQFSLEYDKQYYWRINSKIGQQWMGNSWTASFSSEPLVSIGGENTGLPTSYALYQNFPNPFNPSTTIRFDLPEHTPVQLDLFDLTGRRIQTLLNSDLTAGAYQINFDAAGLASGLYVYRLQTRQETIIKKMMLVR